MALNPDTVGTKTDELVYEYKWQDAALYALGVGAKAEGELDFLYEGRGPKVLPTFAVVPTFAVPGKLLDVVGGDMMGVVHAGQKVVMHRPFDPKGTLRTTGKVEGVYDLKRMGQAVFTSETRNADGEMICETEWSIIFRNDGGFGGQAPPKTEKVAPPEREADFRVEEQTSREQALLYRIAGGDSNPLHADPEIGEKAGFGRPILHGLCTYGYAGRAVLHQVCGGDPAKLKVLAGQFRKPVWPGDTIVTEGWELDGGRYALRCTTKERPEEAVFTNAYAEIG
jgi:acyl dehydratase